MDHQYKSEIDKLAARPSAGKLCPACGLAVDANVLTCPHDGTSLVTPIEQEPEFKDKYEFLGTIGSGGMGVIYKARQTVLNKLVAIKMLHPHMVSTEAFRRFQIEGTAVSRLQHPYIINVHDLSMTESGQPYMVMDFVAGRTLAHVIERDGLVEKSRCLRIFEQICDALAHAHSRGVLHRDLKPSNIMLIRKAGQDEVRIMDFGIAKLLDASEQNNNQLTRTGETIGSPQYMSPEQARGGKTDERSDLYSLGCVFYEALTGAPPFSAVTAFEMMTLHLNEKPLSMTQSLLGKIEFPPDLEAIVARLLEKDPDLRYQSMQELQAALQRVQSGQSLDRFTDTAPERRFNWQAIAIGVVMGAVVTGGVGALYFLKKSAPPPSPLVNYTQSVLKETAKEKETGRLSKQAMIKDMVASPLKQGTLNLSDMDAMEDVNDNDISPLEDAINATEIVLNRAGIDDRGLEHISQLKLEKLRLKGTHVKDLQALKNMITLRELDLEGTTVSSKGMSVIAHLPKLTSLNLTDTGVTDTDLVKYLPAFKNLKELTIQNCTHVTTQTLVHLQSKMLTCHFEPSLTFYPTNSNLLSVPQAVLDANGDWEHGKLVEAAHAYAEAVKKLRHDAAHPDPKMIGPQHLKAGLIARCYKSRALCLIGNSKKIGKLHPELAKLALVDAEGSFEQAEQTLENISFIGWDGELPKRLELCDIYAEHATVLETTRDWSHALLMRDKVNALCAAPNDPMMIRNLVELATDCQLEKREDRCQGLLKEAIRRYQKIGMADSPENALALQRLADVYAIEGRAKEALSFYEQAVSVMKRNPELWKTIKYDQLRWDAAVTYDRLARDAQAEPLLKQILEYEPRRKQAYVLLVNVLLKEHKQAEAARYADQIKAI